MGLGACSQRTYNLNYCNSLAKTYAIDRGFLGFGLYNNQQAKHRYLLVSLLFSGLFSL